MYLRRAGQGQVVNNFIDRSSRRGGCCTFHAHDVEAISFTLVLKNVYRSIDY